MSVGVCQWHNGSFDFGFVLVEALHDVRKLHVNLSMGAY